MVGGHGTLGESFTGKERESDVIVRATVDKLDGHLLGGLDAVGLQVLGQHAGADVH